MGNLGDKKGIGNLDDPGLPFDYSEREYGTVPLDDKRARFQWISVNIAHQLEQIMIGID